MSKKDNSYKLQQQLQQTSQPQFPQQPVPSSSSPVQQQLQQPKQQQNYSAQPTPVKKTAFVHKLYAMLSDESLSNLIWWSRKNDDCVFALHPGTEFANVLTNYFKHGNVSSFVRQLHMYGFHKVFDTANDDNSGPSSNSTTTKMSNRDDLIWEFRHSTGYFRKGDEASLSLIKRRSSNKVVPEDELRSVSPVLINPSSQYYYPTQHYQITPAPVYTETIFQQQHDGQLNSSFSYQTQPMIARQSIAYPPEYVQIQQHPQQLDPQSSEIDHSTVYNATNDIAKQQRSLSIKADYLNNEIRSTVSDVLKFSDSIPKIAPVLKNNGAQYQENLNSLQQNFVSRVETYKPSPLSNEQQQQIPIQIQQQQVNQKIIYPPPYATTVLSNPFSSPNGSRNNSVHFWETSGTRQPSIFVDPLNPSPTGSISGSSSRSSARSSTSTMSNSNQIPSYYHPQQHQYQVQQHGRTLNSMGSVPHIHYQQAQPKRNDSLPTYLSNASPKSHVSRQHPPRSIPDDYNNSGVVQVKSSIPNINHLTSQLRPSVLEIHQNPASNVNPGINNTSVSSNSTYSTLYSANSSISSASSRNSQGSFSQYFQMDNNNNVQNHPYPYQLHRHPTNRALSVAVGPTSTPMYHSNSTSTTRDSISTLGENDKTKLAVSSLLSSPGNSGNSSNAIKRVEDIEENEESNLKRMKSDTNLGK